MPIRHFTASSYVAAQVKNIRSRRGWSQQKLADRLSELLTEVPPWRAMLDPKDPRAPKPRATKSQAKWTQTRIAKLERGALKIMVDDLLELALALDVSPLYLLTPALEPHERDRETRWSFLRPRKNDVFKVSLGGTISGWPHEVRQWIRGSRPMLSSLAYRTDEAAAAGRRFYLVDSQPLGEWELIRKAGNYAAQVQGSLAALAPADDDEGDENDAG